MWNAAGKVIDTSVWCSYRRPRKSLHKLWNPCKGPNTKMFYFALIDITGFLSRSSQTVQKVPSVVFAAGCDGDESNRDIGSGANSTWAHRPEDRVPAPRREDEATHIQHPHGAHDARRRRQHRRIHHGQGRSVRRRREGERLCQKSWCNHYCSTVPGHSLSG